MALHFGVTQQTILNLMPGSSGAVEACDFGGPTIIASLIEIYYNRLLAQLSPTTFEMIVRPDREQVLRYSPTAASTVTVGLFPIKPNTQVRLFTNPSMYDTSYQETQLTATITDATLGTISFTTVPVGSDLWASYEVDLDNVLIPSLANIINYGVASELLTKMVPKDSFGWHLAIAYMKTWDDSVASMKNNDYAVPELRKLTFFNSSTDMPSVISSRKYRGS